MRTPPVFFHEIKEKAHRRWEQLEADPELAGPWRQLFSQVQSPRHVLSELLQNADDAGARSANARIEDKVFIFEHDGEDFQKDHFASLCRFGFSNKRTLHTIGFRGIGFKSTFSLGSVVEVFSPTIAVKFDKLRFTEPVWISEAQDSPVTSIRVRIEDEYRRADLEKNLEEWSKSPASLLFFQNIRKLTISGMTLERQAKGQGPIPDSEKVSLTGKESHDIIIIRSGEEEFPVDAIDEIKRERITGDEDFLLPPCKIEAVIGLPGSQRLFVILPTDVHIALPFSCNAPFMQDSARTGIIDPSRSPTNRWLLGRLGRLVARAMVTWLEDTRLELPDRSRAYFLLPRGSQKSELSVQSPVRIILDNFSAGIEKRNILLTSEGTLDSSSNCIAPPLFLYSIWSPDQLLRVFGAARKTILAAEISQPDRDRLTSWGLLKGIGNQDLIQRLIVSYDNPKPDIPKPDDWHSLWLLWEFLLTKMQNHLYGKWSRLHIVPVEGENMLVSADQSVRQSSDKPVLSDDDWKIIQENLHVLDKNWILYLSGSPSGGTEPVSGIPKAELVNQVLEKLGLDKVTGIDIIVNRAFQSIRAKNETEKKEIDKPFLIRFTHILAALDTKIPDKFIFITRDGKYRPISDFLSVDRSGDLELLLPPAYAERHLLDADYSSGFSACSQRQWFDWSSSAGCGLQQFVGLQKNAKYYNRKSDLRQYLYIHDGVEPEYQYKGEYFTVVEYDFDDTVLTHWQTQALSDKTVWTKVIRLITADTNSAWKSMIRSRIIQRATNGNETTLACNSVKSNWVIRLRNQPCLEDSNGIPHIPSELLMRSAETELLMGMELFVHSDLDTESTRDLIRALGVRTTPASLDSIIQRIKIFSKSQNPPVYELEKIYGSIDRLIPKCSTQEITRIKEIFSSEPLIFSDQGTWCISKDIFQNPDPHDNSGIALVLPQLRHLQMWSRLGVAEKPTFELILESLKRLSSGQQLDQQTFSRVRSLIARAPIRVWNEYGHWISLDRCWVPVSDLMYCYTMQSMFKYGELFQKIKRQTADLQGLGVDIISKPPFSDLKNLKQSISFKISEQPENPALPVVKTWTSALGKKLRHILIDDPSRQETIRKAAERLEITEWQIFDNLRVIPFIDGTPAGEVQSPPVSWIGTTIYVRDVRPVKIISSICDEIAPPFNSDEIREAIKMCIERDESFIEDYLNSTFTFEVIHAPSQQMEGGSSCTILPASPVSEEFFEDPSDTGEGMTPDSDSGIEDTGLPGPGLADGAASLSPDGEEKQPADPEPRQRTPHPEPSLMDVYIKRFNYVWNEKEKQYQHNDGSWLQKGDDGFTWHMFSPDGELVHRFWVSRHYLDTSGFEIDASIYEMVKRNPDTCDLLLMDPEGQPMILSGEELLARKNNEEVILDPAKYRLRRKPE
jgi:hypothetical protein